jgi:cyclopropane-fatty-acyl-phospholipid synthase
MENQAKVRALGFDDEFERMWEYYLAYSEAGFRAGHLDVWQLGFIKK